MVGRPEPNNATQTSHPDLRGAALERAGPLGLAPQSYFVVLLQLAALVVAIRWLELEQGFGLGRVAPWILAGFAIHAWLPARAKAPAFLGISIGAFALVLGPLLGLALVAIALSLVGICHLRLAFAVRISLLGAAGAVLIAGRAAWFDWPGSGLVLPFVGSMFLFRLVVYLYDERTMAPSASVWMRLSYFFLLPNACFLLFPVVDYRTLLRGYYGQPAAELHARGIQWMLRGISHLMAYRFVYSYLTPEIEAVDGLFDLVAFASSSYLLYLRISGHFHLAVGILHLFGFALPETNHHYLLATSFTDCWRRINIYWTEFTKKIIYFPLFMRLRRFGTLPAVLISTTVAFLATWWLHACQWFWLNGEFPLAMDGAFWAVAGVLALLTTALETVRPRPYLAPGTAPTLGLALRRSIQALVVFMTISLIWSLWCSPTPEIWVATMARGLAAPPSHYLLLAVSVTIVVALGTWLQRFTVSEAAARFVPGPAVAAAWRTAACLGLAILGWAGHRPSWDDETEELLRPIVAEVLNARDRERHVAGYYDRLIDRETFGGRVWEGQRANPNDVEAFLESAIAELTPTRLLFELANSRRVEYLGSVVETNRHGMRDLDYKVKKPEKTLRIALLGTCYEMGVGVDNPEVWEAVVERRLAEEWTPRTGWKVEVLNFSVPAYTPLHQVFLTRERLPDFEPDLVLVSNHIGPSVKYLIQLAELGPPYPAGIDELFEQAGVEPGMTDVEVRQRIGPRREEIEAWAFEEIGRACRDMHATPVLLEVPVVERFGRRLQIVLRERGQEIRQDATEAGFERLDLTRAWGEVPLEQLANPQVQHCPNELGHLLTANAFYEALESSRLLEPK